MVAECLRTSAHALGDADQRHAGECVATRGCRRATFQSSRTTRTRASTCSLPATLLTRRAVATGSSCTHACQSPSKVHGIPCSFGRCPSPAMSPQNAAVNAEDPAARKLTLTPVEVWCTCRVIAYNGASRMGPHRVCLRGHRAQPRYRCGSASAPNSGFWRWPHASATLAVSSRLKHLHWSPCSALLHTAVPGGMQSQLGS